MITILDQPQTVMPVYNEITYTVDSDNKTKCNFTYIFDVYIDHAGSTQSQFVTRLERTPIGVDGYGIVDVSKICSDFVSYDLKENLGYDDGIFDKNINSIGRVGIKFGEKYDNSLGCSDGVTIYPNLQYSLIISFWNGALQKDEFKNYTGITQYINKFLSNIPNNTRIGADDKFVLNYLSSLLYKVDYLKINTFDYNGNYIKSVAVNNLLTQDFGIEMFSVGVGPSQLNSMAGTLEVIGDNVYFYDVQLFQSGSPLDIGLSDVKRFEIDRRCSKYKKKRVSFLNRLGGFDSYSFNMQNEINVNIARNEFTKKYGKLNSSNKWTYDLSDRGTTVTNVDASESYIYNSDWMTEEEGIWLQELFTSPEVYDNVNPVTVEYNIISGTCSDNNVIRRIESGVYHSGHIDFGLDSSIDITGNPTFSYVFDPGGLSMFCTASTGIARITGTSTGTNQYHTTLTGCDPMAGFILSGTLSISPIYPLSAIFLELKLNETPDPIINNGGEIVKYELYSGSTCLSASQSGLAKIYGSVFGTYYLTSVDGSDLCIPGGNCGFKGVTGKLTRMTPPITYNPLVVTSTSYSEKYTTTIKNINYGLELKASNKINIQRN